MLPPLLCLTDVPIEASCHGSLLLYRMLQNYPPDRLFILESSLRPSQPDRRLPGVTYRTLTHGWRRPLYTRFNHYATLAWSITAPCRARAIPKVLGQFQPGAVLTVTHEFLWHTAARYAAQTALPLHLVCHDDWPSFAPVPRPFRTWLHRRFRRAWRQAASRLCICPAMAAEYRRRYGPDATVLYPSRAADTPRFHSPPPHLLEHTRALTAAFAGTLNSRGHVRALQHLAAALSHTAGRLLIFGPFTRSEAAAIGLDQPHIELRGLLPSAELLHQLRAHAQLLFVPMSFDSADRSYSTLSFPSKLADCTAAGLPLLIHGPDYSSAVRWAGEHPGLAETVTAESPGALAVALKRLCAPQHRWHLAARALQIGHQFFSHEAAEKTFFSAIGGVAQTLVAVRQDSPSMKNNKCSILNAQ